MFGVRRAGLLSGFWGCIAMALLGALGGMGVVHDGYAAEFVEDGRRVLALDVLQICRFGSIGKA